MSQSTPNRPDRPSPPLGTQVPGGAIILFCAADLLWGTRIKETANSLGIPARPVRNLDMLRARLLDCQVAGLVVDLDSEEGLGIIRALREEAGPAGAAPIVAFGPHVAVDRLHAAAAAGATAVTTRGAFSRDLPAILRTMHGGGSVAAMGSRED